MSTCQAKLTGRSPLVPHFTPVRTVLGSAGRPAPAPPAGGHMRWGFHLDLPPVSYRSYKQYRHSNLYYPKSQPGHRQTLRSQQIDSRSNSNETDSGRQAGTCQARLTYITTGGTGAGIELPPLSIVRCPHSTFGLLCSPPSAARLKKRGFCSKALQVLRPHRQMGSKSSKVSNVAEEAGATGGKATGSVIDKLTEAQLDEFREAFNSFDKASSCPTRT